jgi:hypothetical protein
VEYGCWMGLLRSGGVHSVLMWLLVLSHVCCVCWCVCVSVCECACGVFYSFCIGTLVPLFLLLNTSMHSSPHIREKKERKRWHKGTEDFSKTFCNVQMQ